MFFTYKSLQISRKKNDKTVKQRVPFLCSNVVISIENDWLNYNLMLRLVSFFLSPVDLWEAVMRIFKSNLEIDLLVKF